MKSNQSLSFYPIHEDQWQGDAGGSYTAYVEVGRSEKQYRAECWIHESNQDMSREGVRDRIAARGQSPDAALDALLSLPHGWGGAWTTGLSRAVAEAREGLADYVPDPI